MPDLTILHTGDRHGRLPVESVARIREAKAAIPSCLLLDAGDAISSGNVYYRPGGEPVLARMSDAGYDAMAMGNREFHFLRPGLRSKVSLARFPVLSANLRCKESCEPTVLPYTSFEFHGLKVAVLGLTVPMITRSMFVSNISVFWFDDPVAAAAELVPSLRENADIVIALTHIGLKADMELAARVSGIDLVVGGHTHVVLEQPVTVNNTRIVHAGWWGHYLGRTELTMRPDGPEVHTHMISLIPKKGRNA